VAGLACVILIGLAGFFVLPPIIKTQAEKRLSAELGRAVSIGKVHFNPYMLSLVLEDLDIREKDGSASFLGWARLYVRFDATRSLAGDWVLGAIALDGFHARVVINPDGSFNFSDLLQKFAHPSTAPAKSGRAVRVGKLQVNGATLDFSDRTLRHPFAAVVGPMTFALSGFRTTGSSGAPYHFDALTDAGERLTWSGTLSADPLESQGEFRVENLILKKYAPYLESRSLADVTDGKLTVSGRYGANFDPRSRSLTLVDAEVHLGDLKLVERANGYPVAELKALDVTGIQADALASKATIARVALSGGNITVRRNSDGSVNLLSLLPPVPARPAAPAGAAPAASVPKVNVSEVALSDFSVDIADEAAPHHPLLSLGNLQFALQNFTLADGASMPVHASFAWAPKGTVKVDGTVTLAPALKAELKAEVSAFEILPLSPYLEEFANVRLTKGAFSTTVSLRMSMSGGQPAVQMKGDLSVDAFGIVDGVTNRDLLGFSRLAVTGFDVATSPQTTASAALVELDGAYADVRINKDMSLNLPSLRKPSATAAAGVAPAGPAPKVSVARVVLSKGNFSFSDESVEPHVKVSLTDFGGTVSGLSSENLARADVALKGLVGGAGPVAITGKVDPLGAHKFISLKIDVRNVDLVPLSPYSGKYAGYALERGQLVVDSTILLDGEKVDTANVVTLNQFTFGAASASPDATGLPVRLGVALLKDVDGKVVIDLPVQGSLGDPTFRIGKVVLRVIVNLLTKAAVSPFSLIGSMFGGGGDELAYQEFIPGSTELQVSQIPRLETLAKALANRPALSLGIEGGYDPAADTYALKHKKLTDLVRRTVWEERRGANPSIPPPDELIVSADENAAVVKTLFDAKFPPGTQFGTPLPPPPAVAPPPPAPRDGLIKRVVDAVTFRKQREEKAAVKESARVEAEHEKEVVAAKAAGLPLDEMTGRLAEAMEVSPNDLKALAAARALRVRTHLIDAGHISADRLFLTQSPDPDKEKQGPRVLLTLQ
jgi:Domain of Unknown Function (DUF748)